MAALDLYRSGDEVLVIDFNKDEIDAGQVAKVAGELGQPRGRMRRMTAVDIKLSSTEPQPAKPVGPYQAFMLVLCVLVLVSLAAEAAFDLDADTRRILFYADTAVCVFFLGDFLYLLYTAENRGRYLLTWGWLDLISSVPAIGFLRVGRAARMARLLRIMRGARSARILGAFVVQRRAQSTLLVAALITFLAVVFSSIAVLHAERAGGGNITTADDALWWAIVTVATVGYGDQVPITPEGRVIGIALILVSVGMLSVFTAFIASGKNCRPMRPSSTPTRS